jgi:leucyl-tRNA synthetase
MAQEENSSINRDNRPDEIRYDAQRIEAKWSEIWQQDDSLYAAEPHTTKPKFYVLEMLPYPSGALHMDTSVIIPSEMLSPATCG